MLPQPRQQTQINDRAITGWHKVDDLAHRGRVVITGHDQGTWHDLGRVTSLSAVRGCWRRFAG